KEIAGKRWLEAAVTVGGTRFDLRDHDNDSVINMMHEVTRTRNSGARLTIEVPDHLVQDKIGDFQRRLLEAIEENLEKDKYIWVDDESSSSTVGEQGLAPTGFLG
ncbi:MAG: hypothetical protein AAB802_00945, partial [Patescibacteria group bacterium]